VRADGALNSIATVDTFTLCHVVHSAVVCPLMQLAPYCIPCCCLSIDKAFAALISMLLFVLFCSLRESHFLNAAHAGWNKQLGYLAWNPDAAEDIGVLVVVAPVVYATYLISPALVTFSCQANVREPRL